MQSLLKPLLVCPSVRLLVGPVHASSALMRLSARPHVCLHSVCSLSIYPSTPRLLVRLSFAPRPPIRPSASCPLVRHSPPVCPMSALVRPSALVRLFALFASSKNYLLFFSTPKFFTSCTPHEIATSAIHGANKSHSGIRVRKFPPLQGQP